MALETSGFQLSQFERAPQIPGNIGVVDTKGIYGSVVDALKSYEALRTTQAVQAATDAELALATQKAQTEMGLLGPEAEARKAKAELLSAQAPYEVGLLGPESAARRAKAQLLTAQAPYEMGQLGLASRAKEAELRANIAKSELLAKPEIAERVLMGRVLTSWEKEMQEAAAILANPNSTPEQRMAAQIRMKTAVDAKAASEIEYVRQVDGTVVAMPKRATLATGGVAAPQIFTSQGAINTAPANLLGSVGGMSGGIASTGSPVTKMDVQRRMLQMKSTAAYGDEYPEGSIVHTIPGDKGKEIFLQAQTEQANKAKEDLKKQLIQLNNFRSQEVTDNNTFKTIDDLINLVEEGGSQYTGGGRIIDRIRQNFSGPENSTFQNNLSGVLSNIKLGAMLQLKRASANGATGFGALSDAENKTLESLFTAITTAEAPQDFVNRLLEVKRRMAEERESARNVIQSNIDLARDRGINDAKLAYGTTAAYKMFGLPPPVDLPQVPEGEPVFGGQVSMAPAQITLGAPPPEPMNRAEGPHTAEPLTPVEETPPSEIKVVAVDNKPVSPSSPFRMTAGPGMQSPAPAPAAPALAPAPEPAPTSNAPASPLLMNFINRLGEVNPEVQKRRQEYNQQVGGTGYAAAGPFAKPAETAPVESSVPPASKYSWEAYNERRKRATEQTGLPQITLSPQGVGIAKELLRSYEADQRVKEGKQPTLEITASDGKRIPIKDPSTAKMILGILTGQQAPNLEPRLEVDREATRRLTEDRMRREELARQFRTMPRR